MLPDARFARRPTIVLVFPHRYAYRPFAPLFNGKPIDVAGFFQSGPDANYVTIVLDQGVRAYPVVFHEFAHVFISGNLGAVPVWFGEGVAEYYSSFEVSSDGMHAKVGRAIGAHVMLLRDRFLPLGDVLAATHSSPLYNESKNRDVFYAESWALVHYLLLGAPARTPQLFRFLERLDSGAAPDQACQEAFGVPLGALETELRRYTQHLAFPATLVTFTQPIASRTSARAQPLTAAEVESRLGDLLLHMNRHAEADERLANALRLDPDLVLAHLALGELRIRQQRTAEGLKLLERATLIRPDSVGAQIAYGIAIRREAEGLPRPQQIEAARRAFGRALEMAPDLPEAMAGMAWTLASAGERLDEARRLAERAAQIDPLDVNHVLLLVQVLARQGDFKSARNRLGPLMASARVDVRARARALMGMLAGTEARAGAAAPAAGGGGYLLLRPVRQGEQRAFGSLERIECSKGGILLHVRAGERVLRLAAARVEAVEFISYREDLKGSVACGAREPGEPVYVTWRETTTAATGADGEAVAVEFVPKDFVPKEGKK